MTTYIGDCVNCGHLGSKHKGIDPKIRTESHCTESVISRLSEAEVETINHLTGREVLSRMARRCQCAEYVSNSAE